MVPRPWLRPWHPTEDSRDTLRKPCREKSSTFTTTTETPAEKGRVLRCSLFATCGFCGQERVKQFFPPPIQPNIEGKNKTMKNTLRIVFGLIALAFISSAPAKEGRFPVQDPVLKYDLPGGWSSTDHGDATILQSKSERVAVNFTAVPKDASMAVFKEQLAAEKKRQGWQGTKVITEPVGRPLTASLSSPASTRQKGKGWTASRRLNSPYCSSMAAKGSPSSAPSPLTVPKRFPMPTRMDTTYSWNP